MGSFSSQQASCVTAAPSPLRFFAAWRVEAPCPAVFYFDGSYTVFLLIRGVALHESSSFSKGNSLGDCDRACDPLSCLLVTALWLRCSQSLVVQETPSVKDVDLTCSIAFLFRDATCLPIGPMSLDWRVNPFGRSESSGLSLPPDAPSDGLRRVALPASERSRWYRVGSVWPFPFRRSALCYLEHPGPCWICFLQTKAQGIQTQLPQKTLGR